MSEKMERLSVLQVISFSHEVTFLFIFKIVTRKKVKKKKSESTIISKSENIISRCDFNVSTYNLTGNII